MRRIVVDTNTLVASAYDARSASRQILEAVARGDLEMLVSPEIEREYELIIRRAVRPPRRADHVRSAIAAARQVNPASNPPVTADRQDDKFLAAALAGDADAVVTNDEHLLRVDPYHGIRVMRPAQFARLLRTGRRIGAARATTEGGAAGAGSFFPGGACCCGREGACRVHRTRCGRPGMRPGFRRAISEAEPECLRRQARRARHSLRVGPGGAAARRAAVRPCIRVNAAAPRRARCQAPRRLVSGNGTGAIRATP